MTGLFAFLALVGVLAAVAFFLSARAAKAELAARAGDRAKLEADAEAARKAVQDARAEAKKTREDVGGLRAELERTKKRAFEQQEAARRAGGAPALREEIDKLGARLAETRAEAEHQAARARALEAELQKAAAQRERAKSRAAEAAPAPAPVATPAPAPVAAPAAPAADDGRLALEKERADRAEAKLADARKRGAELERDLKAVRGRLETEKRVYMVQKGELELAGDRYTELRRRHDALRKEHDELVEAVRQAAREERRLAEGAGKAPGEGGSPTAA